MLHAVGLTLDNGTRVVKGRPNFLRSVSVAPKITSHHLRVGALGTLTSVDSMGSALMTYQFPMRHLSNEHLTLICKLRIYVPT